MTPDDRKYDKEHEWILLTGKDTARLGITDFAQKQLGDIVFVELPKVGDTFDKGEPYGSVESVKSVSELYLPVSGTVKAINEALADEPELINEEAYEAWTVEITLAAPAELDGLLTAAQYEDLLRVESE